MAVPHNSLSVKNIIGDSILDFLEILLLDISKSIIKVGVNLREHEPIFHPRDISESYDDVIEYLPNFDKVEYIIRKDYWYLDGNDFGLNDDIAKCYLNGETLHVEFIISSILMPPSHKFYNDLFMLSHINKMKILEYGTKNIIDNLFSQYKDKEINIEKSNGEIIDLYMIDVNFSIKIPHELFQPHIKYPIVYNNMFMHEEYTSADMSSALNVHYKFDFIDRVEYEKGNKYNEAFKSFKENLNIKH